ncbi:23S rRNA (uracil(1939)-C(5))-methyltransferase RlmD [Alkaliphilus serpentinus]|uniref:23S rRNA (Uracil(1939)-C(5))-methyltransferase RlmD n=1 Tax=Alkaliphilus serpentinus TaxID=1482731 RepID=A0A833HLZ8_9FIRM|nr:23S rRNA (uracil(1939)-C(5))-methyltransferase RlmD [Alkaliphilus serpentinus]KAB3527129.1 23S rRNA (uracil(1939)-C(5))-methyltransferase RlmD [Alkaliphilus serpentinus]
MKRKDMIEFTIEGSEFGGKAYGYVEGIKIVVKHGIKGQRVRAAVKKIRNKVAEGRILEIIERSPLEDQETCIHFGNCGGCFQQSLAYEMQLEEKDHQVKSLFDNSDIQYNEWLPIGESPIAYEYRNKMEFTFGDEEKGGELTLGMHKRGKHHDVVTVDQCLIMDEDYRMILKTILSYFKKKKIPQYRTRGHEGYLRHLVIRKASYTGEILVNLVTTTQLQLDLSDLVMSLQSLSIKGQIVGILHTLNDNIADTVQSDETRILFGRDYINEKLLGLSFKISAFSFFQTNTLAAEKLYTIVREFVGNPHKQVVFDLFCGTGTIGQIVAPTAEKVIGIEIVEDAVMSARENAALNGLNNCEFIAGDVREEVKKLKVRPDIIVLDPPRAGIHPQALKDIMDFNSPKIIYVSCNPKTLVRDIEELQKAGYGVQRVRCMDMFPHTVHVETVVLLTK